MTTKRIIELDVGTVETGDYIITDSATAGTKRIDLAGALADAGSEPSTSLPLADGTAAAGTSDDYARADHVHPTDATRASAADLTALADTVGGKPDADASAPSLHAGSAASLTGSDATGTTLPRTSPRDGTASVESIHGRTLVWNQHRAPSDGGNAGTVNGITWAKNADGSITVSGTSTASTTTNIILKNLADNELPIGHKVLIRGACPAGGSASTYRAGIGGVTTDTGSGGIWTSVISITTTFRFSVADGATVPETTLWPQLFDLTAMFGAGNEPSTVAEFEAMFPEPYYPYDAGSLLSVNMTGIETVGFNLWDEEWENGYINDSTGQNVGSASQYVRSKNYIPVFSDTVYYFAAGPNHRSIAGKLYFYDADKNYISWTSVSFSGSVVTNSTKTTPSNARYMRFWCNYQNGYQNDLCINLSGPRNGEYEPYWQQTRPVTASTYFPGGMRSAGSVYDELTESAAVTRVGSVDLGTLTWMAATDSVGQYFRAPLANRFPPNSTAALPYAICPRYSPAPASNVANGTFAISSSVSVDGYIFIRDSTYIDAATFKAAMSGVMLHYALAIPTTTTIDPPLNLTYKAASGGTERITHTEQSAPPIIAIAYGYTAESLLAAAASTLADPDGPTATTNHAVGSYLTMGGTLYRVTTAIATGEAIVTGTNVTATTVMAEVLSLIQ